MVRDAALGTARELDEMPAAISEFQDWLDRRSQLLDSDELLKMMTVLSQLPGVPLRHGTTDVDPSEQPSEKG